MCNDDHEDYRRRGEGESPPLPVPLSPRLPLQVRLRCDVTEARPLLTRNDPFEDLSSLVPIAVIKLPITESVHDTVRGCGSFLFVYLIGQIVKLNLALVHQQKPVIAGVLYHNHAGTNRQ